MMLRLTTLVFLLQVCLLSSPTMLPADEAAKEQAPSASIVELFQAIDQGDIEAKFIAKSSKKARLILKNTSDRPLRLELPEAFAGVPVLAQFGAGGGGAVLLPATSGSGGRPFGRARAATQPRLEHGGV